MRHIPPSLLPLTAAKEAANGLLGDIYTRRWQTAPKKKKGRKSVGVVEHELKLNAASILMGGMAVGGALLTGAVALWMTQQKVQPALGKTVTVRLIMRGEEPDEYWTAEYGVHTMTCGHDVPADAVAMRLMAKVKPYDWKYVDGSMAQGVFVKNTVKTARFHSAKSKSYGIAERKGFSGLGGISIGGGDVNSSD